MTSRLGQPQSKLGQLRLGGIDLPVRKTVSDTAKVHFVESGKLIGAARLTQAATETLVGPGSPNPRIEQAAVESLVRRILQVSGDTASIQVAESASKVVFGAGPVRQNANDAVGVHLAESARLAPLPYSAAVIASLQLVEHATKLVGSAARLTQGGKRSANWTRLTEWTPDTNNDRSPDRARLTAGAYDPGRDRSSVRGPRDRRQLRTGQRAVERWELRLLTVSRQDARVFVIDDEPIVDES